MSDKKLFLNFKKHRRKPTEKEGEETTKKKVYFRTAKVNSLQKKEPYKRKIPSSVISGENSNQKTLVTSPEIFILNESYKTSIPIRANAIKTGIGFDEKKRRVLISNSKILGHHLILVDQDNQYYFLNRTNDQAKTLINGMESLQFIANKTAPTFFKLGNIWGVYFHPNSEIQKDVIKGHNYIEVQDQKGNITRSEGQPLILGSSPLANIPILEAPDFLGIIYWNNKGIFIDNLTDQVNSGLKLNNEIILGTEEINNNSILSYFNQDYTFFTRGSTELRIKSLSQLQNTNKRLYLSSFNSTEKIQKAIPFDSRPFTLGSGQDDAIYIENPDIEPKHCYVYCKDNQLTIKNNSNSDNCHINSEHIFKATMLPGDILSIGSCELLLHYEIF